MLDKYINKQTLACSILKNIILKKEYSHAYLIETNGYDEGFDFALTFVKEIFCSLSNDNHICEKIDNNNYPELRIINPDGMWIKKEQISDLQDEFKKKAIIGDKKIYILNHADRINVNTSNSILKFLEEPEEGIIALLICDNRYKLLDTIVSRCQIISLNGNTDLSANLSLIEKIGQTVTRTKEEYELFLQEKNDDKVSSIIEFIDYYEKNGKKVLCYIEKYWTSYLNTKEKVYFGLITMLLFYKDTLNIKLNRNIEYFNDYIEKIENIKNKNSILKLTNKINLINDAIQKIDANANLNLIIDKLIIEMDGE